MQFVLANGLLAALPPAVYERLAPHFERVRLEAGDILYDAGASIDYTWFITGGVVSLLSFTEDGASVEAAMVGRDSVIGFPSAVRRNGTAFRAQVQVAGRALRISAKALRAMIKQEIGFYEPLLDQALILSEQIAQEALCNQFHSTDQRLARWLLLARDRTFYDAFTLTHVTIAQILGISRSGVSSAAGLLQTKGLIRYARGRITILNHKELEASSCECYRIISQTINSYLPSSFPSGDMSAADRVNS